MIDVVVKVGGSLGRSDGLRALCSELASLGRGRALLVVPGGGAFADAVREYDDRVGLRPEAAHWAAVLGMDAYGTVLADLMAGAGTARSLEEAGTIAGSGRTAVFLPFAALHKADPLPRDWSVTSDSIAAWVAAETGARLLVLLKDARGMAAPLAGSPETPTGEVGLDVLRRWEGVDGHVAVVLQDQRTPDVWIVDGGRPERLRELLETGRTQGVSLAR